MSSGKGGSSKTFPSEQTRSSEPITFWHDNVGTYPGNNIIWWMFKRPIAVGNDQTPKYFLEVFDPGMRTQLTVVNARAAAGHYIYDAFHMDRSGKTGIAGLQSETSYGARPSVTTYFAGRAWYGGVSSTKYSSRIYFSQILERPEQGAYCYQVQDPTQETAPELASSDGGVIVIPEMQQLIYLFPLGHSLIVMASNGIWAISGSSGVGFSASDYSVSKISDTPVLSQFSIVDVDGNPVFWNRSGIWMITMANAASFNIKCLTDQTIREFFLAIPDMSKKWAKGAYNKQEKIIQWIYSSTSPAAITDVNKYDSILNLNVLTGAFYPWSVSDARVTLNGIFAIEGEAAVTTETDVYVGASNVVVGVDQVLAPVTSMQMLDSKFKYIVNVSDNTVAFTGT